MSARQPDYRSRAKILELGINIATLGGAVGFIDEHREPVDPRGGNNKNPDLPEYTFPSLLATFFEVTYSAATVSHQEVADRLWFTYTDTEMAALGLAGWRNPEMAKAMTKGRWLYNQDNATNRKQSKAAATSKRAWKTEYQRCWKAFQRFCEPINDMILNGHESHTIAEIDAAAASPEAKIKRVLRLEVCNRIILGSLATANAERFPSLQPLDLLQGILKDWPAAMFSDGGPS